MRITGGSKRGRLLISPDDDTIRPTADKTRLAVFNMVQARRWIVDAVVLDAFCGTGALGIEAVSRGAARAVLMDNNPTSLALAQRNVDAMGLGDAITTMAADATVVRMRPQSIPSASLIFLDPPYRQGLIEQSLPVLDQGGWIDATAVVVMETEKEWVPTYPDGWELAAYKTYGHSAVYILTRGLA